LTLRADAAKLSRQVCERLLRHALVIKRMVADLEAVLVKLRDLVPRHVVLLVRREVEAFRDKERGAELVFQEEWPCDPVVRLRRIIKRQYDELIGDWLQRECR